MRCANLPVVASLVYTLHWHCSGLHSPVIFDVSGCLAETGRLREGEEGREGKERPRVLQSKFNLANCLHLTTLSQSVKTRLSEWLIVAGLMPIDLWTRGSLLSLLYFVYFCLTEEPPPAPAQSVSQSISDNEFSVLLFFPGNFLPATSAAESGGRD